MSRSQGGEAFEGGAALAATLCWVNSSAALGFQKGLSSVLIGGSQGVFINSSGFRQGLFHSKGHRAEAPRLKVRVHGVENYPPG